MSEILWILGAFLRVAFFAMSMWYAFGGFHHADAGRHACAAYNMAAACFFFQMATAL